MPWRLKADRSSGGFDTEGAAESVRGDGSRGPGGAAFGGVHVSAVGWWGGPVRQRRCGEVYLPCVGRGGSREEVDGSIHHPAVALAVPEATPEAAVVVVGDTLTVQLPVHTPEVTGEDVSAERYNAPKDLFLRVDAALALEDVGLVVDEADEEDVGHRAGVAHEADALACFPAINVVVLQLVVAIVELAAAVLAEQGLYRADLFRAFPDRLRLLDLVLEFHLAEIQLVVEEHRQPSFVGLAHAGRDPLEPVRVAPDVADGLGAGGLRALVRLLVAVRDDGGRRVLLLLAWLGLGGVCDLSR